MPTTPRRTAIIIVGGAALLAAVALGSGCNALLDIDEIEFGNAPGAGGNAGTGGGSGGTSSGTSTGGTSSGTSTGGTGLSGGSGGAGGGEPFCPETCDDGIDNDGNDLIDCQDPCCADWTCVDASYDGWMGPVAVYTGTDQALACPGRWPSVAIDGGTGAITAPPATCSSCSCGAANGVGCSGGLTFYTGSSCTGTGYAATGTGSCQTVPSANLLHDSAEVATESAAGGSCTASGGVATLQPASYATRILLCGGVTLGAGCSAGGSICTPPPPSGFDETLCIHRNGNRSCNGLGPFSDRRTINEELVDTRDCTTCTCSSPTGATCSGGTTTVHFPYTDATCGGSSSQTLSQDGGCANLTGNPGSMDYDPGTASGGTCTPSGGTPTGGAYDGGMTTLCCIPPP